MPNTRPVALAAAAGILCATALNSPAHALPVFAHRYGFSCEICHTAVPHLTPFGQAFARAGFRLPDGERSRNVTPLAVKVNVAYTSAKDPSGLPKAMLDELELLTAGPIAKHLSYRAEQYAVDGGVLGSTRDAWLSYASNAEFGNASAALRITGGEFTLPLPVDPETQRDTENHYGIFDQTVGGNPFNFFADKIGLDVAYGKLAGGGTDIHLLALKGHDSRSGLPSLGLDRMVYLQMGSTKTQFAAYRYDGSRPLLPSSDRFWREGIGVNDYVGNAEFDGLLQSGEDSSADGLGSRAFSNGGFLQLRWTYSPRLFSVVRYDATNDAIAGMNRSLTTSLIYRPYRNSRLTVEEVLANGRHTLNTAWLFAY